MPLKPRWLVAALVLAALTVVGVAVAYFSASGAGTASASVGSLSAPLIGTSSSGAGTATVTWNPVNPPVSGTSVAYTVNRDGSPVSGCTNIKLTTCTDSGLAKGGYSYTVTALWRSWTATSTAAAVTVDYGAPSQIVLSQSISGTSLTSGSTDTLTAKIEDAAGNVVASDSSDSVSFVQTNTGTSGAGSVTGLGSATATNGVATKTITGNQAGTVNLQASGGFNGNTGTTSSNTLTDTVLAGTASQIVLSGATTDLASGSTRQLTATIEDAAGNTITSGSDSTASITFSQTAGSGSLTGLSTVAASGGVATDTVTGTTAGSVTVKAAGTINGAATNSTSNLTFNVTGASATVLGQYTPTTQSNTFTTSGNISTTNGGAYLVVIYCYGSPSCASGQTDPTITGPFTNSGALIPSTALTVVSTFSPSGSNVKSCIEVVQETGNGTSTPVTVTLGSNENVAFVDVLQLSPGAKVQGTPAGNATGATTTGTTATAAFSSAPAATNAEVAVVGLTGNTGSDTITAPSGFTPLGTYQHSSTISGGTPAAGGDLGMYFNPAAQTTANFTLSPLAVNWGTIAIQIG
jgi:hypothetical protein